MWTQLKKADISNGRWGEISRGWRQETARKGVIKIYNSRICYSDTNVVPLLLFFYRCLWHFIWANDSFIGVPHLRDDVGFPCSNLLPLVFLLNNLHQLLISFSIVFKFYCFSFFLCCIVYFLFSEDFWTAFNFLQYSIVSIFFYLYFFTTDLQNCSFHAFCYLVR